MEKKDILIGGAWPYANYYLHVGHLAALLPGDVIAKYYREKGDNVIYVSGSDCHGTPITERARKEKTDPKTIATFYHEEFIKTFDKMNFEYDLYSNTMRDSHISYVKDKYRKIYDNGYVYEKEELGVFCTKCNKFLSDREIEGTCPYCGGKSTGDQCDICGAILNSDEVLDKHCKLCGGRTFSKNDKQLYFKLSEFKDELVELIDKNKDKWRKIAIGEAWKYINTGLAERATVRNINWGIPVPVSGYENKRIYVWIEALLGYLSACKEVCEKRGIDFNEFINKNNKKLVTYYVHGKDNIAFHTTIYPALLIAIEEGNRLPDYMISSAYVNLNKEKMSKSKGNLITVNELLDNFDSDTLRFYFSYRGPETNDVNCSVDDILKMHNKYLVGMFGNFVNRNLAFIHKKNNDIISEGIVDENVKIITKKYYELVGKYIEKGEIRNAMTELFEYISFANKYYDSKTPWISYKEDISDFNNTTYTCLYIIANLANMVKPFLPTASNTIRKMIELPECKWEEASLKGEYVLNNVDVLYKRLDETVLKSNEKIKVLR